MSPAEKNTGGRILLGLTPLPNLEATINAAICLAEALNLDIVGLLIQQKALMDMAESPLARTLDRLGRPVSASAPDSMQRELERFARQCQHVLSVKAGKVQVNWTFKQQSGELASTIVEEHSHGDYLVVTGSQTDSGVIDLQGLIARLPDRLNGIVVVPQMVRDIDRHDIVVLLDREYNESMLRLCAQLASLIGGTVHFLVMITNNAAAGHLVDSIRQEFGNRITMRFHRVIPGSSAHLATTVGSLFPAFVLSDIDSIWLQENASVGVMLRATKSPILLVKESQDRDSA